MDDVMVWHVDRQFVFRHPTVHRCPVAWSVPMVNGCPSSCTSCTFCGDLRNLKWRRHWEVHSFWHCVVFSSLRYSEYMVYGCRQHLWHIISDSRGQRVAFFLSQQNSFHFDKKFRLWFQRAWIGSPGPRISHWFIIMGDFKSAQTANTLGELEFHHSWLWWWRLPTKQR